MRWAFWRRRRGEEPDPPHPATVTPDASRDARAATVRDLHERDDRDERDTAPVRSGASPTWTPAAEQGELGDPHSPHALPLGASGVRRVVVELVRAVLAGERDGVAGILARLRQHEADLALAPLVAATALGPRLLVAADVDPDRQGQQAALAGALAQGDTLVERAEQRRRALAPHVPADVLRRVVRDAVGVAGAEAPPSDAEDTDLLLAAAVLLAQGCADGQGDPTALDLELAQLLPGA